MEKFSVLISVYHKENPNYFDKAIRSLIIEQTIIPDEVVLVVDGPVTEELDHIINNYHRLYPNIMKVYRLQFNVGLGRALHYGLQKCSYNLVARADSDDINVSNRFELQLNYFHKNPHISVLGGGISEFNLEVNDSLNNIRKLPTEHKDLCTFSKFRNPLNHMTVMFKKDNVISVGSYLDLAYLEDYYLWVRLIAEKYQIANLKDILVNVRIGNGMLQRRSSRKYISGWKVLAKFMLDKGLINYIEYIRNIISIYIFIYMPISVKKLLYKYILRK